MTTKIRSSRTSLWSTHRSWAQRWRKSIPNGGEEPVKPINPKSEEALHARMARLERQSATVVLKNPRVPFYVVVKLEETLPKKTKIFPNFLLSCGTIGHGNPTH